jgi:sodium transport system permease protein
MSRKHILTVYLKELRDLLRDRRTLMSMIFVPTLLMPTLTIATLGVSASVLKKARATPAAVVVIGGEDSPKIRAALATAHLHLQPAPADWRQRIVDKRLGAAVELPPGYDERIAAGEPVSVTVYDYEGEVRSRFAVDELRRFLGEYRDRVVAERLQQRGLSPAVLKPFEVVTRNVAPPEKVGGNLFGGVIPYFFLLLAFTGAMYPAMDLTAGEKERGTMETILCSPVSRLHLVLGKFLMVLTASLGTVACSLGSTAVTLLIAGAMLGGGGLGGAVGGASARGSGPLPAIDPLGLLAVVAMVVPMAVLFAAAQFTISLFAKSFKEAQSYLSPLIVVIILPAVIGMLPGVELNPRLALVPILNVSLVSKELVSGVWHWGYIALIFGSSSLYAALALGLAARMFNREEVMFRA